MVVLAGFGRFGQTILEHLNKEAAGELQRAILVDLEAGRKLRAFTSQVGGVDRPEVVTIDGEIEDPRTWERVDDALAGTSVAPVFVVGTHDDRINLRVAMQLRREHARARIFVRCVYESAFSAELAQCLDFEVLAVEAMLREALREQLTGWL